MCHSPTSSQLNPIGCPPQVGKEKELMTSFYNVSALINQKNKGIDKIFATTCWQVHMNIFYFVLRSITI